MNKQELENLNTKVWNNLINLDNSNLTESEKAFVITSIKQRLNRSFR